MRITKTELERILLSWQRIDGLRNSIGLDRVLAARSK